LSPCSWTVKTICEDFQLGLSWSAAWRTCGAPCGSKLGTAPDQVVCGLVQPDTDRRRDGRVTYQMPHDSFSLIFPPYW
jgi:hypothetical protein